MLDINGKKRVLLTKVEKETVPADVQIKEINMASSINLLTVGSEVIYDYFAVIKDDGRDCEIL